MGKYEMSKELLARAILNVKNKYGKDSITALGSELKKYTVGMWSTGVDDIDHMLGGGMPEGRIVEVWGPESSGKTSFAYHLASQVKFSVFCDAEGTFDEDRAATFGVKPRRMHVNRPECGEEAVDVICEFADAGVPLIIVDSVPSLFPKKVVDADINKEFYSPVASLLSKHLFPKLIPILNGGSPTTILFVNQVRDNITKFGWGDPYSTPGGRALKHHASIRIEVRRRSWIGAKDSRYGLLCAFRVVKSKISRPFTSCEIPLLFDAGYVENENLKSELKRLRSIRKAAVKARAAERNVSDEIDDEDDE